LDGRAQLFVKSVALNGEKNKRVADKMACEARHRHLCLINFTTSFAKYVVGFTFYPTPHVEKYFGALCGRCVLSPLRLWSIALKVGPAFPALLHFVFNFFHLIP
jgi:hypothetical protein